MPPKIPNGPIKIDPNALKKLGGSTQIILDTAKAYAEAAVAVTPGSLSFSLLEQKQQFARVGINTGGGGYYAILKQVNGIWVVILTAQGQPGKDAGSKYGLPEGWYSTEY
jgi:hypothetical protein